MKLWLLKRNEYSYDETESYVICAKTEDKARKLAKKDHCKTEGFPADEWTDPTKSTCEEVSLEKPKIIHSQFNNG